MERLKNRKRINSYFLLAPKISHRTDKQDKYTCYSTYVEPINIYRVAVIKNASTLLLFITVHQDA